MTTSARRGLAAAIVVAIVAADAATKQWAETALRDGPIWLIGHSVGFVLAYNTGSAFLSLFSSATPVLAVLAIVAAVVLARAVARASDPWMLVGLSLFLGGALGNLVDRVFRAPGPLRGAVVDFVKVGPWPLFNLADSAITVGAVLVAVAVLRDRPGRGAPEGAEHGG